MGVKDVEGSDPPYAPDKAELLDIANREVTTSEVTAAENAIQRRGYALYTACSPARCTCGAGRTAKRHQVLRCETLEQFTEAQRRSSRRVSRARVS